MDALRKLTQNLSKVAETHDVLAVDVFTADFMASHCDTASFPEFFEAAGGDAARGFDSVDIEELEATVRARTSFPSWGAMKAAAGAEWARRLVMDGS
jgi:hypothetical protein